MTVTPLYRQLIACGLTQTTLAQELAVTQSTVSLWLSGRTRPSPKRMKKLAKVMKVTPMELTKLIDAKK
jgi:transcriptional regulator with XRE-family HTH domain